MASSRASTPAGRSRSAKRADAAKPAARKRTSGHGQAAKPAAKKTPPRSASGKSRPEASKKPPTKPKAAKPTAAKPRAAKPKATKPKATKPKAAKPNTKPPARGALLPRALTIAVVVGALTIGLAAAYWFWFRDSSFVAVEKVNVEGIEGPEADAVVAALTRAGEGMTTLNVDEVELATSVSRFPSVVAVEAEADFPHGLTIQVTDRPPVLSVSDGGPAVPAAADGTILRNLTAPATELPEIQVEAVPPKGGLEGEPLVLAQVAGAAPEPLRPLISGLEVQEGDGIVVTLEGGIPVKFGDPAASDVKWAAVSAVLANPQVKTLTHLDVRVPERPSIGGAAPALKGG